MKMNLTTSLLGAALFSSLSLLGCGNPSSSNAVPPVPTAELVAAGGKVYAETCASCHMADASGVPNMQPALDGSAVVAGDPTTLIRVVLQGPDKVLPADRPSYSNTMPAFANLSDDQISQVLTYLRQTYGAKADPIYAAQVKVVRTQVGAK